MEQVKVVTLDAVGDLVCVEIANPPVNATSTAVRAGLLDAVAEVERLTPRAAVLVCRGKTFVAGGDMSEFDASPREPHLPDVVNAIEACRVPWIAAMHGSVLGGGLEVAMGCAWRLAHATTRFGLPEVAVGLVPGAGGSQRLPRLLPMEHAIAIACRGETRSAHEMLALGAIDHVFDGDPREAAAAFARALPERPASVSTRPVVAFDPALFEKAGASLEKGARGQRSPMRNLEALRWASRLAFADGQAKERALHLEMRRSDESRALRHLFFAERKVAKPEIIAGMEPRDVACVAVIGGGLMGSGITTAALLGGLEVIVLEQDEEMATAARARILERLAGAARRAKLDGDGLVEARARLTVSQDFSRASRAQVAIEAVFEDMDLKKEVLARLSAVMAEDAILATNTSYLDPREIFRNISGPERCLGLHFFNPAHLMTLVEIVALPETFRSTLATGFSLARRMRKTGVLSGICEGFIGNRMMAAYRRAAEYLLADGAYPHEVDAAMRAFGMPMGPFELNDLTGLHIAWAHRKRQAATRDPRERYTTIGDQLCEAGRFGQRTGKGWYRYLEGDRTPCRDPQVEALIDAYSAGHGIVRRPFDGPRIAQRLVAVLANEGARIVEEDIARDDAAVDVVKVLGFGFPRWLGGPMHFADRMGWPAIARTMREMAEESPHSWTLARRLG